jgi:hypothetical protein
MPYGMCPACGTTFHMSVGDVGKWYQEYHPLVPVADLVPASCYYCSQELKTGDQVVIRNLGAGSMKTKEGERGTIQAVNSSKDGCIYQVKLVSGQDLYFVRTQLRKLRQDESK